MIVEWNCPRAVMFFFGSSICSLSASDSLSEHSMTFEFSEFKFMRLARLTRLAQFRKIGNPRGFWA